MVKRLERRRVWSGVLGEVASQRNRQPGTSSPLLQNQDLDVYTVHTTQCKQQGLTTVTALCLLYLLLPDRDRWRWMRVPYHYHHGERAKIPWARQGKLATPPVPVLQGKGNGRQAGDRLQAVVGLGKAAGAAGSTASIVYFLRQLSQPVNTTG